MWKLLIALATTLSLLGAVHAIPLTTSMDMHGTFEHMIHIKTPGGKTVEVNIYHNTIVEDNTVAITHNVQITVEGNTIKLKGKHSECTLKIPPKQIREMIREQIKAQVKEINITEKQVITREGNELKYTWKPVYEIKVHKKARLLGIIAMDLEYNITVDPETGEILNRGPWWLVFFVD